MAGMKWADEFPDYEPRESLEPFFIFVTMAYPSNRERRLLYRDDFDKLFFEFHGDAHQFYKPCTPAAAFIQYMIWLDREETKQAQT